MIDDVALTVHCLFCNRDCSSYHIFHERTGPMCLDCSHKRQGVWSEPKWHKGRTRVEISQGQLRVLYYVTEGVFRAIAGSGAVIAIPVDAVRILLRAAHDPDSIADEVRDELFA